MRELSVIERIQQLTLHQTIDIGVGFPDYMTKVMRVPGGLIYEKIANVTGKPFSTCFVPHTDFHN